jgi:hypothetical protein
MYITLDDNDNHGKTNENNDIHKLRFPPHRKSLGNDGSNEAMLLRYVRFDIALLQFLGLSYTLLAALLILRLSYCIVIVHSVCLIVKCL